MAGMAVEIKEYDGGRAVEMESASDLVFLEAGGHCYSFDRGIFIRAMERMLGIAVILEMTAADGDFALP